MMMMMMRRRRGDDDDPNLMRLLYSADVSSQNVSAGRRGSSRHEESYYDAI